VVQNPYMLRLNRRTTIAKIKCSWSGISKVHILIDSNRNITTVC
jgi:hypothetical protein